MREQEEHNTGASRGTDTSISSTNSPQAWCGCATLQFNFPEACNVQEHCMRYVERAYATLRQRRGVEELQQQLPPAMFAALEEAIAASEEVRSRGWACGLPGQVRGARACTPSIIQRMSNFGTRHDDVHNRQGGSVLYDEALLWRSYMASRQEVVSR